MSSRDTALAVLMRKPEWLPDEAAFEVGGGRYSDQQRRELATALNELSAALRESTDEVAARRRCRRWATAEPRTAVVGRERQVVGREL